MRARDEYASRSASPVESATAESRRFFGGSAAAMLSRTRPTTGLRSPTALRLFTAALLPLPMIAELRSRDRAGVAAAKALLADLVARRTEVAIEAVPPTPPLVIGTGPPAAAAAPAAGGATEKAGCT